MLESPRLWREGGVDWTGGFDLSPLNRYRPGSVVLEAASLQGRTLVEAVKLFGFDLRDSAATPNQVDIELP